MTVDQTKYLDQNYLLRSFKTKTTSSIYYKIG